MNTPATKLEFVANYVHVQVGCQHKLSSPITAMPAEIRDEKRLPRARRSVTRRVANGAVDAGLTCIAAVLRFGMGVCWLLFAEVLWPLAREVGCMAGLGACCAAIRITRALEPHLLNAGATLRLHSRLLHKSERSTALAMRGE
jgi:hypothetical protein